VRRIHEPGSNGKAWTPKEVIRGDEKDRIFRNCSDQVRLFLYQDFSGAGGEVYEKVNAAERRAAGPATRDGYTSE
jgi:hypothetical protein